MYVAVLTGYKRRHISTSDWEQNAHIAGTVVSEDECFCKEIV